MAKIEASVVINRPIEEVSAFLENPENALQWQSGLLEARQTSEGPVSVGTTYRYVSQVLGRRIAIDSEVTAHEPGRLSAWKSTSGPFPLEGRTTLEPIEGGTKVTSIMEGEPGGFFKLAEPLVVRMYGRQMETDLNNLKEILEAQV